MQPKAGLLFKKLVGLSPGIVFFGQKLDEQAGHIVEISKETRV